MKNGLILGKSGKTAMKDGFEEIILNFGKLFLNTLV